MITEKQNGKKILNIVFLVVLALYPLRHISLGVEVTDGAYSAGNYRFLENINPMWRFATYLANVAGHFFTELPGGHTLIGLRFYTALFVSVLAVIVYLFFTRVIRLNGLLAFLGELLAVSLCWCPTTILYNYMTYFFFDLGIVVIYMGLVRERRGLLFLAGILLGMNVLVRFPNLTEAALILSVWYYGFLQRKRIKDVVQETGICLLGYLAGAGAVLVSIAAKYGFQEYITGIVRLMQMPSEASDYSAKAMVLAVLLDYKFSAKWLVHMLILAAAGCFISALAYGILKKNAGKGVGLLGKVMFTCGILVLIRWWHAIGVFNIKYYTYESMFQWVAVFLILTIIAGFYVLFSKKCTRNEKLLASMTLILIGITPLGSNNHLYPNMNNMFLVFPFGLSCFWQFWRNLWEYGEILIGKKERRVSLFPIRMTLAVFLGVTSLQCLLFGAVFTFRDGMSGEKRDTKIEKNTVLKEMTTNAPLAEAIESLTEYVETEGLSDRRIILYGQVPALSYMLDMQPAISTSWPDLPSYHYEVMAEDMGKLKSGASEEVRPLIILGDGPERWIRGEELTEEERARYMLNEKWEMLYEYMAEQGYERVYENEMFFVYNIRP
ncbi:MAG: hypothetical protein HDQ96_09540 [Lachnospiraceae bacterium]|nr:hypothetical protein [Lachnospiraceae bacterium]